MLKWYLHIYIYFFIEYLKCVWKSNCICIIQNDSKKKKRDEDRFPGPGLASGLGQVRWRESSQDVSHQRENNGLKTKQNKLKCILKRERVTEITYNSQ